MPGGDKTGPQGMGPMTGRGAGFCAGYGVPGYTNPGYGQGLAFGAFGGRGRRNRFFATSRPGWRHFAGMSFPEPLVAPQDELDVLKGQAHYLDACLKGLQARMEALASAPRNKTE